MGGAMDLVASANRVVIAMERNTKDGRPQILKRCTLPLTGQGVANRLITELAVIDVTPEGLLLKELAEGATFDAVQSVTEPTLTRSPDLRTVVLG
jgi:3-oxoacid CoA-transferase subunit B